MTSFELDGATSTKSADRVVRAIAKLVRGLPEGPRALWNSASRRVFSIGIQAGDHPHQFATALRSATLRQVVDLDAEIEVTVYGPVRD